MATSRKKLKTTKPLFLPTSEWNFFPFEAINGGYENRISSRFDIGRLGRGDRGWLRGPATCLYSPATGGRRLLPRPKPSARARSGGTSAGRGSGYLSTPSSASRGSCTARACAGLRLDRRILELEWRRLDLGSRPLGASPFPRGGVVWRALGLSRRAARLGAWPLALRRRWLE
jgi:hypothetical protein